MVNHESDIYHLTITNRIADRRNRRTLQRDMRGLVDLGLVFSEGATNKLYYRFRDSAL